MAQKKKSSKKGRGAASAEAVEKRMLVRKLNQLLSEGAKDRVKLDGRKEKRRKRLVEELKKGKNGKALKPVERVAHVHELLQLGETLTSLRKQGVKTTRPEWTEEALQVAAQLQEKFGFDPAAWRIVGLTFEDGKPKEVKRGGRPKGSGTGRKGGRKAAARKKK